MAERDLLADMRAVIDKFTTTPCVNAAAANEVVDYLRRHDPELLHGWLDLSAVPLIHQAINRRDATQRSNARRDAVRGAFRDALNSGDADAIGHYLDTRYVVDDAHLRKPLRDLTKEDLVYVAAAYDRRAASDLFEAAFHRALAERLDDGQTVGDRFGEAEVARLREGLKLA